MQDPHKQIQDLIAQLNQEHWNAGMEAGLDIAEQIYHYACRGGSANRKEWCENKINHYRKIIGLQDISLPEYTTIKG